jgi:hypothetical protein
MSCKSGRSVRSTLCDSLTQFLYRHPSFGVLCKSNLSLPKRLPSASNIADSGLAAIDTLRPRTAGSNRNLQLEPARSKSARGAGPNAFAAVEGERPTAGVQVCLTMHSSSLMEIRVMLLLAVLFNHNYSLQC